MPEPLDAQQLLDSLLGGGEEISYEVYFSEYQTWLGRLSESGVIPRNVAKTLANQTREYISQLKAGNIPIEQVAQQLPEFSILFRSTLGTAGQPVFEKTSSYERQDMLSQYTEPFRAAEAQKKLSQQMAEQEARAQYELASRREGYRSAYGTQRAEAAARGGAYQEEPVPPLPEASSAEYMKALTGMSPAMKRYFGGKAGNIYGQFVEAYPAARQAWWKALNPQQVYTNEEGQVTRGTIPEQRYVGMRRQELSRLQAQQLTAMGDPTVLAYLRGDVGTEALNAYQQMLVANIVEGYNQGQPSALSRARESVSADEAAMAANYAQGISQGYMGEGYNEPKPAQEDPWLSFIKSYPFKEQFAELSPKQKGFYSRQYKPAARWTG